MTGLTFSNVTAGERAAYRELLLLADEDPKMLARYQDQGVMLVARKEAVAVGSLLAVGRGSTLEIMNLAVLPDYQRQGIASALVTQLIQQVGASYQTLLVGTGDADLGNLHFYLRNGFRIDHVRKDFFKQYAQLIEVGGVVLQDMVMLTRSLELE